MSGTPAVTLRPETPEDEAFLRRLFFSVRSSVFDALGLDDSQRGPLLEMQFRAQRTHYLAHYPCAEFQILLDGDVPIGNLTVDNGEILRIVDIALLPEYRNRGIGCEAIQSLLGRARREAKRVRLQVEERNPALRLYARLGFVETARQSPYVEMTWTPS